MCDKNNIYQLNIMISNSNMFSLSNHIVRVNRHCHLFQLRLGDFRISLRYITGGNQPCKNRVNAFQMNCTEQSKGYTVGKGRGRN